MINKLMKLVDFVIFATLWVVAYHYYRQYMAMPDSNISDALIFDAVNIAALIFVMLRRPDVNTVSLAAILLIGRSIDALLLQNFTTMSGWFVYPVLILFNVVGVILIWFRPLWASKIKDSDNYAVTNQDQTMVLLFACQALFMLVMLIEHAARRMGFEMMFFYTYFPFIQFFFTVIGVMILYFMTFDASKIKRSDRKKFRVQDGLQ
jgi:hypothetical protein